MKDFRNGRKLAFPNMISGKAVSFEDFDLEIWSVFFEEAARGRSRWPASHDCDITSKVYGHKNIVISGAKVRAVDNNLVIERKQLIDLLIRDSRSDPWRSRHVVEIIL